MRLSGLSLAAVFLFCSCMLAQHSSSSSGSSSSSSSSSSNNSSSSSSSHASSSGGSSYSGGSGSHSSGGGSSSSGGGGSHSSSGGHSASSGSSSSHGASGNHGASGAHGSGVVSMTPGSGSYGKGGSASNATKSPRPVTGSSSSKIVRPVHEPKEGISQRAVVPEKRSFFSFLRHPFRKPEPKVVAQPALYLPRPICPKGRCAPPCPVGQVRSGGVCTSPVVPACIPGQTWNGIACGYNQCSGGQIWTGSACLYHTRFLDNCFGLRAAVERQAQRVQAAESVRQNACANGPAQECSNATSAWQGEENMRQNLLMRYRQCQIQSASMYSAQYGLSPYDSTLWFDSLRFNAEF